jgi:hypothetical protein
MRYGILNRPPHFDVHQSGTVGNIGTQGCMFDNLSRNRRGCRRPCTSRQSRRSAGSPRCTGSDTRRSHRANLPGPSRSRVPSIPPGRKTSRSAGDARPPMPQRARRPARAKPARRTASHARPQGAVGISACRKASNGCGSVMGSGRAARPSAAKTRNSPSRSVAMCNAPISTRRTSSRASACGGGRDAGHRGRALHSEPRQSRPPSGIGSETSQKCWRFRPSEVKTSA